MAARIGYLFKLDPVAVLDSTPTRLAIRLAAALVIAADIEAAANG